MKKNLHYFQIKTRYISVLLFTGLYFLYPANSHACNVKAEFSFSTEGGMLTLVNLSTGANAYWISPGDTYLFEPAQWDTLKHWYGTIITQTYTVMLVARDTNFLDCADTFRQDVTISPLFPICHVYAYFEVLEDSSQSFSGLIDNKSYISRPSKTNWTWHFGDGDSSNSVNPTHIYPGPGTYNLCVSMRDSTCYSTYCDSVEFDTNGTMKRAIPYSIKVFGGPTMSIKENNRQVQRIKIMPNPGNGWLNIQNSEGMIRRVKIMNSQGKEILSETHDTDLLKLDFSERPQGFYFIVVTDEHSSIHTFTYVKTE